MKRVLLSITMVVFLLIPIVSLSGIFSGGAVYAQGGTTDFLESCPPGVVSDTCQPPTLQQIEFTLVRLLYALWGSAGIIFLGLAIYNGFQYMFAGGEEEKLRELRGKAIQWLVGLFLIFLAVPIVSTIMKIFIADGQCFGQLRDPGFSFFFPDVCTQGDAPLPQVSPTP